MDANGNTTLYSYTEDDYLESVTNGQSSVEYDYDTTGRLKTITNGDAVYSFEYNAFGATESIAVGDTVISEQSRKNTTKQPTAKQTVQEFHQRSKRKSAEKASR